MPGSNPTSVNDWTTVNEQMEELGLIPQKVYPIFRNFKKAGITGDALLSHLQGTASAQNVGAGSTRSSYP